jgi:DNA mismatch repair protein MutL
MPVTRIRKLSTLLINQIAAGEVIERPASVVKELVENSIDAGATRIDVLIEQGGSQLIRISDNGNGILPDELPLAIAPHATSKLRTSEELGTIVTMGFRGEALASVASISRLKIYSRPTLDSGPVEAGASIEVTGDEIGPITPASGAPGTVIEVRDLFYNTPARRKFLKGAPTEYGHIAEIVDRIAMAHPAVGFTLSHNGRKTLDLPPGQSHRERCVGVLGKELDKGLLEFQETAPIEKGGAHVWGLAGLPEIARPTAKFQYLYLNARPIKDRSLSHAMKEAYRGLMPPDMQPVVVVFLSVNPEDVDVNVHPAKSEVRFREPGRAHGIVLSAIRQRLLGADLTPRATFAPSFKPAAQEPAGFSFDPTPPPAGETPFETLPAAGSDPSVPRPAYTPGGNAPSQGTPTPVSSRAFVDYFKRMEPSQKGFVYQQVKDAMGADAGPPPEPTLDQVADSHRPAPSISPTSPSAGSGNTAGEPVAPILRTMGVLQIHKSYLVTQDEQGLLIIDQHALHERVMFEELSKRILSQNLESQRMLMPGVVRANARRQSVAESMRPLLEKIGVELEPLGPDTLAIQAFPSFLFERNVTPEPFIRELLDKAEDGTLDVTSVTAQEAVLHEVLDMMACKAAIKAGDKMTPEELAALLAKREEIERSSNCPHGRPTTIRMTLRDLEKQFKRG